MIRLNNMSECWQSLLLVSRPFSLLIPLANSLHQQVGFNEFRGCRPSRSSMLTSSFSQVFSRYRLSFVLSVPEPTCDELYSLRSLLTIWTSIVQHIWCVSAGHCHAAHPSHHAQHYAANKAIGESLSKHPFSTFWKPTRCNCLMILVLYICFGE